MNSVLSRLKEISNAVMFAAEAHDLEIMLERIAHAARELVKTKYAALGVPDGQGGLSYFKVAGLTEEQAKHITQHPEGRGLIGAIMRERKVIRLNMMENDPRSSGFPKFHPHMTSFLGAPIIAGNHLYGMLYLSDKDDETVFDDADQQMVEMLAGYAALAIAGAELSQQQSRLNLLEERERIAMELHDGVIQSLYGIGMQVDLMRHRNEQVVTTQDLDSIVDNLNNVIEDIRRFIGNLRTGRQQMTIRECFHYMKDRLHPPEDIEFTINAPASYAPFSPAVFESICLIANEAMSNAIRHAEAERIRIDIEQNKSRFHIEISDNGCGFDPEAATEGMGLGLHNMQQRARLFGGEVIIDTKLGQGTTLQINIPIGTY
jgi:signal transduction histidine kinase